MSEHKHVSTCKIVFLLACASLLDTGEIEVKGQGTIARSSLLLLGFVTCWLSCYSRSFPIKLPWDTSLSYLCMLLLHSVRIPHVFSLTASQSRKTSGICPRQPQHSLSYFDTILCSQTKHYITTQPATSIFTSVSLCPHRSRPTNRHSGNSSLPDSEVRGTAASDDLLDTSLCQL